MNTRRQFLIRAPFGLVAAAAACRGESDTNAKQTGAATLPSTPSTPGAPVAFNTAPAVGPEVSATTFAEAEKLAQVTMTDAERATAVGSWRKAMAPMLERRTGPRKVALEPELAPASVWDPSALPGVTIGVQRDRFIRSNVDPGPLPSSDAEIAYAPVTRLSRWIQQRKLTSERLTGIYLARIDRFDSNLRCVITLTREQALARAKHADAELAAGKYRGPLHAILRFGFELQVSRCRAWRVLRCGRSEGRRTSLR